MNKSASIRATLADKQAEVKALFELAETENRDFTADEKAIVDKIQGIGNEPGEIQALQQDLERAIKFEARVGEIANSLQGKLGQKPEGTAPKAIVVPAKAKLHGSLKAFKGEDAERDAYVAGRWVAANLFNHKKSKLWLREHGIKNVMSESEDDRGGLFVPVEMSQSIIRLVEEYGVFRRSAGMEPMGSDRKVVPVRISGLTATPVAETTRANAGSNTVAEQDLGWDKVELIARKWKVVCRVSDELNEDSLISLAEQVSLEAALAFAYAEDNAGFNGDGTSTYHGIVGVLNALNAGSIYTAASGNTAFSTLDMADFEGAVGQLPDYPGINPAWYISKEGYFASMHRLLMAAGGNDSGNLASGGGRQFLGLPVVFSNTLNKTLTAQADAKLCVLGDLRMGVKFGDRRKVTMSVADQVYWTEDMIAIKATERFDINVHSRGTSTAGDAGALVVLQAAAS